MEGAGTDERPCPAPTDESLPPDPLVEGSDLLFKPFTLDELKEKFMTF
jgi:hypothetical protein